MKRLSLAMFFIILNLVWVAPTEATPQNNQLCIGIVGLTSNGEPLIYDYSMVKDDSISAIAFNHPAQITVTKLSNNQTVASTNGYLDPANLDYTVKSRSQATYRLKFEFAPSPNPIYAEVGFTVCQAH